MKTFLIWSNEHQAWWKEGRWGYTTLTHLAHRFSEAEADEILKNANLINNNEVKCVAPHEHWASEEMANVIHEFINKGKA